MKDEIFNLTQLELSVLLSSIGVTSLYGLVFEGLENVSQTDVYNALNRMVAKEILTVQDDAFLIADQIKNIINIIGQANSVIYIYSLKENLPVKFCYCDGTTVVIAEKKYVNSQELRITCTDKERLIDILNDEGYIPEATETLYSNDFAFTGNEMKISTEKFMNDIRPVILMESFNVEYKIMTERIAVTEHEGVLHLLRIDISSADDKEYDCELLKALLNECLSGKEKNYDFS